MEIFKFLLHQLKQMNLPSQIVTGVLVTLATPLIIDHALRLSKSVLSWFQSLKELQLQNLILAILLLVTIIQLLIMIKTIFPNRNNYDEEEEEEKPEIIFSNIIIFRKIKRGKRTLELRESFALSPKIGIKNGVEILNTRMTLFYAIFKQRGDSNTNIVRDGVEQIISEVNYVEGVHRYSFFSDELPFTILKRIITAIGIPNNDQIIIVLTGSYGKNLKKFYLKHEYRPTDIVIADDSPKVIEYSIRENQRIQTPDWDKIHSIIPLSSEKYRERIDELEQLVKELDIATES